MQRRAREWPCRFPQASRLEPQALLPGGPDNLLVRVAKRQEAAARTSRHRVNGSLWRRRPIPARSASECINTTYALLDKPAVAPTGGVYFHRRHRDTEKVTETDEFGVPWPRRAAEWPCRSPQASRLEPRAIRTTPITPLRFVLGRATPVYFHRRHRDTEKVTETDEFGGAMASPRRGVAMPFYSRLASQASRLPHHAHHSAALRSGTCHPGCLRHCSDGVCDSYAIISVVTINAIAPPRSSGPRMAVRSR